MMELLDGLDAQGFTKLSQRSREQILRNVSMVGPEAAAGIATLVGLTLFITYGAPDPQTGQNPNWQVFGYPGPTRAAPSRPKTIKPIEPEGDELTLEADVCIVGSGAGGGVIAGELSKAGLKVCVVEAAGYFNESDFDQLELSAYENMYWRGGPQPTADFNVTVYAGAGLGGGTVINWTNCLRTRPWVREQWAQRARPRGRRRPRLRRPPRRDLREALGERPLLGPERPAPADEGGRGRAGLVVGDDHAQHRRELLRPGVRGLHRLRRPDRLQAQHAADLSPGRVRRGRRHRRALHGRQGAGRERPRRGCRGHVARPRTGRSAGHRARAAGRGRGRLAGVAGAAAPLRIGGPAVGNYLRIHPCTALFGIYGDDQKAWWGPPHAGLVDEFAAVEDGYGFLVETTQYAPALVGSALPFTTAQRHKEMMEKVRYGGTFIGLLRDHGHGHVDVDANGQAVPYYDLTDELDIRNTHRAIEAQARLHEAAGAREIQPLASGTRRWRAGDDLDECIARGSACRCGRAASACSARTRWARAGWARTRRPASPGRGASCTTPRACGSATAAPSHALGHQPDDLDHGARAAYGRRDRGRAFTFNGQTAREPVTSTR